MLAAETPCAASTVLCEERSNAAGRNVVWAEPAAMLTPRFERDGHFGGIPYALTMLVLGGLFAQILIRRPSAFRSGAYRYLVLDRCIFCSTL